MMRFAPIFLLASFPAAVSSVSCSYFSDNEFGDGIGTGTGGGFCSRFEMDCGSADTTKASTLTLTHDFAPLPIVPSMDDLMFYKTFEYEFQFENTLGPGDISYARKGPPPSGNLTLTSSPDGNVTGVCTRKPSKITWQVSAANSSDYLVCSEINNDARSILAPTACCKYIFCDDGGTYVDASTCWGWSVAVGTVPEGGPVVYNFQIEQSKSGETDCSSAGGKTHLFGPALLGMIVTAAAFFHV